jgi:protein-S-isoprenylcysteine O-methyltransferase Ste14
LYDETVEDILLRDFLLLFGQVSAILLVVLAGWGISDLGQFFADPARAALVAATILGAAMLFVLRLDLNPLRKGRLPVGDQTVVLLALALVSLLLLWFLPFADRRHVLIFAGPHPIRYLGVLALLSGIAVRLLALRKLERNFSAYVTLQQEHQLVQSGIYAHIRHPLYLSLLLAAPGVALVFASLLVFPVLLLTVIFVVRRIRQEEKLLERWFGEAFLRYRSRTWAVIPRIV